MGDDGYDVLKGLPVQHNSIFVLLALFVKLSSILISLLWLLSQYSASIRLFTISELSYHLYIHA